MKLLEIISWKNFNPAAFPSHPHSTTITAPSDIEIDTSSRTSSHWLALARQSGGRICTFGSRETNSFFIANFLFIKKTGEKSLVNYRPKAELIWSVLSMFLYEDDDAALAAFQGVPEIITISNTIGWMGRIKIIILMEATTPLRASLSSATKHNSKWYLKGCKSKRIERRMQFWAMNGGWNWWVIWSERLAGNKEMIICN